MTDRQRRLLPGNKRNGLLIHRGNTRVLKKILLILALGYMGYSIVAENPELLSSLLNRDGLSQSDSKSGKQSDNQNNSQNNYQNNSQHDGEKLLQFAYQNGQSDLQVEGTGEVVKLLADDNQGSRHQRFLLRLSSGQTLLIAHNIDLAPRIESLQRGDSVTFFGEYEWNDKGGVIHWTHRDPRGRHPHGWLKHQGKTYQ